MSIFSVPPRIQLILVGLLSILSIWLYQSSTKSTISLSAISLSNVSLINGNINSNCQKSLAESDGFICEPSTIWNERKYVYSNQDKKNMMKRPETIYFLSNWHPNFHCSNARRIGTIGDGGKWVCDVYRLKYRDDCLIYSIGSSGDFSFELDLKNAVSNCEIHTFDKNLYLCPADVCTFHQIIFGNGTEPNGSQSWMAIIEKLNHTNRMIDILKIDIEGGEYSFFPYLFKSPKSLFPRQILIELHPTNVTLVHAFFELLRNNNYVIFSKENNLIAGPYFFEYAFLKLNPLFFIRSYNDSKNRTRND